MGPGVGTDVTGLAPTGCAGSDGLVLAPRGAGGRPHEGARHAPDSLCGVLYAVTLTVFAASAVLAVAAGLYAWRDRLIDDRLLLVAAVLEVALLVQAVVGVANLGDITGDGAEKATFAAYALTLPLIPPAVAFLAIKEKTRWAMGVIAAGAFAVAIMTGRLQQIWDLRG
jgi:hypothetical protein